MAKEEEEYEVDSIVAARLERKRGRNSIAQWKYRVRWKGYSPNEDTWEPSESFDGSENIIERFWERAITGGRDYRDVNVFKAGEEFVPMGPPRKKQKRKSVGADDSATKSPDTPSTPPTTKPDTNESDFKAPGSSKRRNSFSPSSEIHQSPAKRPREYERIPRMAEGSSASHVGNLLATPNSSTPDHNGLSAEPRPSRSVFRRRKKLRTPSPEVIPDSDEEYNNSIHEPPVLSSSQFISNSPASTSKRTSPTISKIPYHRLKATNPLVKSIDDTEDNVEGRNVVEPSSNMDSKKSGPSLRLQASKKTRHSLLTAEKGVLKVVRGKHVEETHSRQVEVKQNGGNEETTRITNNVESVSSPPIPISGEELLSLAGLRAEAADDLPDFEEGGLANDQTIQQSVTVARTDTSIVASSLYSSQLFPSGPPSPSLNRSVKMQTIFGSLGFGLQSKLSQVAKSSDTQTSDGCPLLLVLDASVSLPVVLTNVSPTSGLASLQRLVGSNGPPGKFYKADNALSLISTLRTSGPSGRITIGANASQEDRLHFQRLLSRLDKGELFLALAGSDLLAFCSPMSELNTQRLNIPAQLVVSSQGHILVTRVEVNNYSEYADLAVKADDTRWIHYAASLDKH